MRSITFITIMAAFCACLAGTASSAEPTPQPRRPSGLTAVTMEHKLHSDINAAKASGRDVSAAEKLKRMGDAELREGKLHPAIEHFRQAEKALGGTAK